MSTFILPLQGPFIKFSFLAIEMILESLCIGT